MNDQDTKHLLFVILISESNMQSSRNDILYTTVILSRIGMTIANGNNTTHNAPQYSR